MRRVKGFTLIELLMVIAIIALLMAILVPTLQRVRKQAKAVVCQSNLRQWGNIWATYTQDNDGSLPGRYRYSAYSWEWSPVQLPCFLWGWNNDKTLDMDECRRIDGISFCPLATKLANPTGEFDGTNYIEPVGGTFLAWGRYWPKEVMTGGYGSYGVNWWVYWSGLPEQSSKYSRLHWRTSDVKGAYNIPIYLDSCSIGSISWSVGSYSPPERDAVPNYQYPSDPLNHHPYIGLHNFCINRHDGYVNGLFMDWSVRKVGLKELWTLKWHREFDTAND